MKTITIEIKNYEQETPELRQEFKELGLQAFDSSHFQFENVNAGTYEIKTEHIFSNQYDTVCGLRVFEKCTCLSTQGLKHLRGLRIFEKCTCLSTPSQTPLRGYYISKGIEKIRAYQKTVSCCHYCGKRYVNTDKEFCTECRGSEYLKKDQYHLLKLTNLMDKYASDETIIPTDILRDIEEKQGARQTEIAEKQIVDKLKSLEKQAETAKYKHQVFKYLIARKVPFNSCIFYSHTDTFCFGWSDSLTTAEKTDIQAKISDRPFKSKVDYK